MKAKTWGWLAAACVLILSACGGMTITKIDKALTPADTVFLGGKVLTVNDQDQVVEAIAIVGDRIVAIGIDKEIKAYQGSGTKTIDLGGGGGGGER